MYVYIYIHLRSDVTGCPESRDTTGQLMIVHAKINRKKRITFFIQVFVFEKKKKLTRTNSKL